MHNVVRLLTCAGFVYISKFREGVREKVYFAKMHMFHKFCIETDLLCMNQLEF